MRAAQEKLSFTEQATDYKRHQNPELQKDLAASKVDSTADIPRDGQLSPNYFPYHASELHNMVTCDNEASSHQTRLKKLTKTQLRDFLESNEVAKSIVQELADLKAVSAA